MYSIYGYSCYYLHQIVSDINSFPGPHIPLYILAGFAMTYRPRPTDPTIFMDQKSYPLVICYITMERSTIFKNGKPR